MDFFKGKQSEENNEYPDKYQPATPIVPLHGQAPKPASMDEYQRASHRKVNSTPELSTRARTPRQLDYDDRPPFLTNLLQLVLWPLKLGCRGCGCLILLAVIGGCALITYMVLAKPAALWLPFTGVLNGDAPVRVEELQARPTVSYSIATESILTQTRQFKIGTNKLIITQAQFQAIVRSLFQQSNITNIYTSITQDQVELLWNFAQDPDQQVWFIVRLGIEDGNRLAVKHIGFNNIGLPQFLNKVLVDTTLSSLNVNSDANVDDVLTKLLNLPETAKITRIDLKPELIEVEIKLESGLDNLFN